MHRPNPKSYILLCVLEQKAQILHDNCQPRTRRAPYNPCISSRYSLREKWLWHKWFSRGSSFLVFCFFKSHKEHHTHTHAPLKYWGSQSPSLSSSVLKVHCASEMCGMESLHSKGTRMISPAIASWRRSGVPGNFWGKGAQCAPPPQWTGAKSERVHFHELLIKNVLYYIYIYICLCVRMYVCVCMYGYIHTWSITKIVLRMF